MSRHSSPSGKPSTGHTAIIDDVAAMWSKLYWDAEIFRDIQIAYPDEPEPLAYAAINVCIAANSLKDWVQKAVPRSERGTKEALDQEIRNAIPLQAMCDAIANTSKHSSHSDEYWGGSVSLAWEEGDEWAPEGYVLRHVDADGAPGGVYGLAANHFHALLDGWWAFLLTRSLVKPDQRTPAWMQRKLRRTFPSIDDL